MTAKRPKILIVEDEGIVADDLRSKLDSEYQVTGIAASGDEAVDLAKKNPPDLVLMDVRLKGDMNGVQTAIIIQSECRKPVPVLFLSALSPQELAMLRAVERYKYIRKPVHDDNLFRSIQEMLKANWYTIEEPAAAQ